MGPTVRLNPLQLLGHGPRNEVKTDRRLDDLGVVDREQGRRVTSFDQPRSHGAQA